MRESAMEPRRPCHACGRSMRRRRGWSRRAPPSSPWICRQGSRSSPRRRKSSCMARGGRRFLPEYLGAHHLLADEFRAKVDGSNGITPLSMLEQYTLADCPAAAIRPAFRQRVRRRPDSRRHRGGAGRPAYDRGPSVQQELDPAARPLRRDSGRARPAGIAARAAGRGPPLWRCCPSSPWRRRSRRLSTSRPLPQRKPQARATDRRPTMWRRRTVLTSAVAAAILPAARAEAAPEKVLRVAMTVADIPLTSGQPEPGRRGAALHRLSAL